MKVTLYGVHFADVPFPGNLAVLSKAFRDRGHQVRNLNGKYFGYKNRDDKIEPCDLAFVTGAQGGFAKIPPLYKEQGIPCFVFDLGWMRRDLGFNQLCLYNLNNPFPGTYKSDRLDQLGITLKPRRRGSRVLICGQKANDAQHDLGGLENISAWSSNVISQIRAKTSKEIVFRPHPKSFFTLRDADYISSPKNETIVQCLQNWDIDVAIMYNSTSALECIAEGVSVIALSKDCMYEDYVSRSLDEIDDPKFPDTGDFHQFLSRLSYNQYTPVELSTFEPIEYVLERFKELS
jgi:hypothetical protein